jgi:protein-disulfide isomerase
MKKLSVLSALGILLFVCPRAGFTQQRQQPDEELKAMRREVEAIKESQTAIQKDLQEIKSLLRAKPAAQPAAQPLDIVLNVEGEPFKGDKTAKVVLVEFSDYQCSFCARYVRETLPQIETDYIKTGKLKYVFRDLPLESIHQYAFKAAEAASCAGEQGKFWEMHDRLYANQTALSPKDLAQYAQAIGLGVTKFQQCIDSGKYASSIRRDMAEAGNAGVTSTPSFLLGVVEGNSSKVRILKMLKGSKPFAAFKDAIDNTLSPQ